MSVMDLLWERASQMLFVSREDFERGLEGWSMEVVEVRGVPAYVFVTRGPEFHFHSLGNFNSLRLKEFGIAIQKLIDQHGYAETRTPRHETTQRRVNERFGFFQVGEDDLDVHFRIERINRPCR